MKVAPGNFIPFWGNRSVIRSLIYLAIAIAFSLWGRKCKAASSFSYTDSGPPATTAFNITSNVTESDNGSVITFSFGYTGNCVNSSFPSHIYDPVVHSVTIAGVSEAYYTRTVTQLGGVYAITFTGAQRTAALAGGTIVFTMGILYSATEIYAPTQTFSFSYAGGTAGAITPIDTPAPPTRILTFTVTNTTGANAVFGIYQLSGGTDDGTVLFPVTLAPGGSYTWHLQLDSADTNTYQAGQLNAQQWVSNGAISGNGYLANAGTAAATVGTAGGYNSGTAGSQTVGTTGEANDSNNYVTSGTTNVNLTGGQLLSPPLQTASGSGQGNPLNTTTTTVATPVQQPTSVATTGVSASSGGSNAGAGTTGPGTGGASDTGLANNAAIINTGLVNNAAAINTGIAAAANGEITQSGVNTNAILKGLSGVQNAVSSGNSGSGTGTDNTGIESRLSTIVSDLSTTGSVGYGYTTINTAIGNGLSGVTTNAAAALSAINSGVASSLGGAGTAGSNATFTGTGVGTGETGTADGFLAPGNPDQPFGTIQLSPAIHGGAMPAQNFTLSMSSTVGGLLAQFANALNAVSTWVFVVWFVIKVQDESRFTAGKLVLMPSATVQPGVENMVLGSAQAKQLLNAAAWVTVLASVYAIVVAEANGYINGAGGITNLFHGSAVGSSHPFLGTAGEAIFEWCLTACGIATGLQLLASFWVLRWAMTSILLSASAILRYINS